MVTLEASSRTYEHVDAVPFPGFGREISGLFQATFASVGDDLFIASQPTEKALRDLEAKGVTTVVNLRMPEEVAQIGFDEAPENPYGPKELDTFAATLASAQGKVLLHCTVAWRASHLWAAYLIRDRKVPVAEALSQTRMINLRDGALLQLPVGRASAAVVRRLLPAKAALEVADREHPGRRPGQGGVAWRRGFGGRSSSCAASWPHSAPGSRRSQGTTPAARPRP